MIRGIRDFASRFGAKIGVDENSVVKKENRYFLINEKLKRMMLKGYIYAGSFLGETRNEKFFPGFELLRLIAEKQSNKIVVDRKSEWLFVCGRDIFKEGIVNVTGLGKKGDYTIVLNQNHECLGFGRIMCDLEKAKDGVVIENLLDVGDFLRRETRTSKKTSNL
jgi:ribosome biogenesis protein Nip4